jgi:hypothetical protein
MILGWRRKRKRKRRRSKARKRRKSLNSWVKRRN